MVVVGSTLGILESESVADIISISELPDDGWVTSVSWEKRPGKKLGEDIRCEATGVWKGAGWYILNG